MNCTSSSQLIIYVLLLIWQTPTLSILSALILGTLRLSLEYSYLPNFEHELKMFCMIQSLHQDGWFMSSLYSEEDF